MYANFCFEESERVQPLDLDHRALDTGLLAVGNPLLSDPSTLTVTAIDNDGGLISIAGSNTVQATSTGVAVYRTTGMSLFVSGEHHWALSVRGLETWDGSWHNGMYPAVMSPPDQDQPQPAQPAPASVEAVTLVQVRQDVMNTIVVEDAHGSMLTVETVGGCPDMVAALGDHIFMRSGGTQTDLVLLKQHEICAVATVRTAEGN